MNATSLMLFPAGPTIGASLMTAAALLLLYSAPISRGRIR